MHRKIVSSTLHTKPKYSHTEYYYLVGKWVVTYSKYPKHINDRYSWVQSEKGQMYETDWKESEWKTVKEMPKKQECIKFVFEHYRKLKSR